MDSHNPLPVSNVDHHNRSKNTSRLWTTTNVLLAGTLLRAIMLVYGLYQDATSPFKYTDIDYFVFTDAARFVSSGQSPYNRATYRYTPLLAWLLLPTATPGFFSFGKVVFAIGDLVAGYLIIQILKIHGLSSQRAVKFSMIWLLNPMVATISTRGSSEGLLGVMVVGLLYAAERGQAVMSGVVLGLAVHFKIYPFIYAPAILLWMRNGREHDDAAVAVTAEDGGLMAEIKNFVTMERLTFVATSLGTFLALNAIMYGIYGFPFLEHTYLYHLTRVDHRHNFSPYNILLYYLSSPNTVATFPFKIQQIAFIPQLLLSACLIPLLFAKHDLPTTMFVQTLTFVTFNKVCTSQYFMWYLVLFPFYLHKSSFLGESKRKGVVALVLWVVGQAFWLHQGYALEFLGESTFFPGLFVASLLFFIINTWIIIHVIGDMNTERYQQKWLRMSKQE